MLILFSQYQIFIQWLDTCSLEYGIKEGCIWKISKGMSQAKPVKCHLKFSISRICWNGMSLPVKIASSCTELCGRTTTAMSGCYDVILKTVWESVIQLKVSSNDINFIKVLMKFGINGITGSTKNGKVTGNSSPDRVVSSHPWQMWCTVSCTQPIFKFYMVMLLTHLFISFFLNQNIPNFDSM